MDQILSYSNVNHASTNLPFAIIPVLSRVDPHQRTHQTWDLPLARHANPGPVVPPGLLRATLETGLMQTRAFGQKFLKAEALILMDDTVFPQDFVG